MQLNHLLDVQAALRGFQWRAFEAVGKQDGANAKEKRMTREEFNNQVLSLSAPLYRVAYYFLESESDARDAVQDIFVKLWRGRDMLDSVSNLKAYCIAMMRNLCYDTVRKASRMESVEITENLPGAESADRTFLDREKLSRVMQAIEKLPKSEREILRMHVFEGLSYEEISQRTGKSNINLRVRISQARKTLKALVLMQ